MKIGSYEQKTQHFQWLMGPSDEDEWDKRTVRGLLYSLRHQSQSNFMFEGFNNKNKGEWVIKFNSLSGDSGQLGPYNPYKLCNHSVYTLESLSSLT